MNEARLRARRLANRRRQSGSFWIGSAALSSVIAMLLAPALQAAEAEQATPGAAASDWCVAIDGLLRERFESSKHPIFGLAVPDSNDYLLQRAAVAADIRYKERFRGVVELVSGLTFGWAGSPPPTQEDPLDILQGFAETAMPLPAGGLSVRIGRQELSLGSSRLVSVRESPNIRRAFDGVRATWTRDDVRIDAFAVRPVFPEDGTFDDRSSAEQSFWGIYGSAPSGLEELSIDLYYLGLRREDALFAQGQARELRHSVGARLFGERGSWDWNFEAVWQWGSFGGSDIRAWTASSDAGYTFSDWRFTPRLGLKTDAISGDRNLHDQTLGTFNPLFPKLPYFSEANLATPANLLDIQPSLTLSLPHRITLSVSWNALWKYAKADAFYAPPLMPVEDTSMTSASEIGRQFITQAEWNVADHLTIAATYVGFEAGRVPQDAGGRAGTFFAAWIQLTF